MLSAEFAYRAVIFTVNSYIANIGVSGKTGFIYCNCSRIPYASISDKMGNANSAVCSGYALFQCIKHQTLCKKKE